MLAKRHRLTTAAFNEHFKRGRRIHGTYMQLIIDVSPTFHGSVVVGKKVYKHAVNRNRLRRRLYDILRQQLLSQTSPLVCICIVKPAAAKVPYHTVRAELADLLAQLPKK